MSKTFSKSFVFSFAAIFLLSGFFISATPALADAPTQLKIITAPQTINQNTDSAVITVESQDGAGILSNVAGTTHVDLTSDSATGLFATSPASGPCNSDWAATQTITIATGTAHKSFCYKDSAAGTFTITVTDEDSILTSDSQSITITAPPPPPDTTPPTTTATAVDSSLNPYTFGNLSNKDITITLSADDGTGSGVKQTSYSIDGVIQPNYTAPFTISKNGTTTIDFYSVDNADQVENTQTVIVNIEKIPPVVTVLGDNPINIQKGNTYTEYGASATDNIDGPLTAAPSGSVDTNTPGIYTITYSATDSAGNTGTATRTVNVFDSTFLTTDYLDSTYGETVVLTATLKDSSDNPVAGKTINFSLNGTSKGSATTDATGVATLSGVILSHANGVDSGFFFAGPGAGVYANFAGDPAYIGSTALANLNVAQRPLTVLATTETKTYDGTALGYGTPSLTGGSLAAGDTVTWQQNFDNKNVGTGKTLTPYGFVNDGNGGGNYWATFVPVSTGEIDVQDVSITVNDMGKTYGDADPVLTYSSSVTIDPSDVSGQLSRGSGEDIGTYGITQGSLVISSNYNLTSFTNGTFTIGQRTLNITADPETKFYGDADPYLSYTASGLVGTDTITGDLVRVVGEDVGVYAISQGTISASSNYNLVFTGDNLTIKKRPLTITANNTSKTYGEADPAFYDQITSGSIALGENTYGYPKRSNTGEDVGTYAIEQGSIAIQKGIVDTTANYDFTFVNGTLTINPATLIVTGITASNKTYDNNTSAVIDVSSAALTGVLGGDTVTLDTSSATGAFSDKNAGVGKNVTITGLTLGGAQSGNYTLTPPTPTANIDQLAITVTADSKTKFYGQDDPALTYTNDPLIGTDSFSGALTRDAGESAGNYNITQGTLTAGGNYNITFVPAIFKIESNGGPIPSSSSAKTGDINGDGKVNEYDLAMLMANWGLKNFNALVDLNHDGVINEYDFAILMANFSL